MLQLLDNTFSIGRARQLPCPANAQQRTPNVKATLQEPMQEITNQFLRLRKDGNGHHTSVP
jgi:hypothetical protein